MVGKLQIVKIETSRRTPCLCGSYIATPELIWNSNAQARRFAPDNGFSGLVMTSGAVTSESNNVFASARRLLARIRDWPADGNSPYSPVYCVSLLLAVGLIIGIGR